jgi:vacuolar-type H+-ATPase subunit B/Vma2
MNAIETKFLPCALTDSEHKTVSRQLAETVAELRKHQSDSAIEKKAMSEREKHLETEIDRLGGVVFSGQEYRNVEVSATLDWDHMMIVTLRRDTGETIEQRAMTLEERQMSMHDADEFTKTGVTRIGAVA